MTRQEELVALLNQYNRAYYAGDAPLVSDTEYDTLYDELLSLERETGAVDPCRCRRLQAISIVTLSSVSRSVVRPDCEPHASSAASTSLPSTLSRLRPGAA